MLYRSIFSRRFFMKQTKAKKTNSKAKRTATTTQSPARLWITHLVKSLLIALATGLTLLLIGTTIAYFTPNPTNLIPGFGLLASAITAIVCGYSTAKQHQHAALLCGLYAGSLCILTLLLISLFLRSYSTGYAAWISCLLHVGFVLCSVCGAYLGAKPPKKRKKRH